LSVAEIAAEVGYSDPFYFSRRFRRAFGHAPADER
jgi:AraC-like DNA-binding protein